MQAHDFKDHSSLLPCPFCGAAWVGAISGDRSTPNRGLFVYNNAPNSDTQPWAHVVCLDCSCGQSSIEKWQTRVPATQPAVTAVTNNPAALACSQARELDGRIPYAWCAQDQNGTWWAYHYRPVFDAVHHAWFCSDHDGSPRLLYRSEPPKNAADTLTAVEAN